MKTRSIFNYFLAIIILVGCLTLGIYMGFHIKVWNPLSSDPIVSGIHLSSLTRDELLNITHDPAEITIKLEEKTGNNETVLASDFLANPVENKAFKEIIKKNALKLNNPIMPVTNILGSKVKDDVEELHYNQKGIDKSILTLKAVSDPDVIPSVDAYGVYNKNTNSFDRVKESIGTEVDTDILISSIKTGIENASDSDDQTLNLEKESIYKKPKVTYGSEELDSRIARLNKTLSTTITYKSGWSSDKLTGKTYGPWLSYDENGDMVVDASKYKAYLQELAKEENLYTSKEEALQEKEVMSGYLINYDNEINEGTQAIIMSNDLTRSFETFSISIDDVAKVYDKENQAKIEELKTTLGNDFVYISIDQQYLWFVKDGNILTSTPVTTGTKNSHDTPKGLFKLDHKSTNEILRGSNGDGTEYASPVDYWMPFNGPVGIHDADNWRSQYGGNVYIYNGSHGCVNTPREKCKIVFENISPGTYVLVE